MKITYHPIKKRLLHVLIATIFLFVLIIIKLGLVILVNGTEYQSKALDQWVRDLPLTAIRGDIVDTNGELLATSQTSYTIYVRGRSVEEPETVANTLSHLLNLDYDSVYKKVTRKGISETVIKRQVDSRIIDELRKIALKGVYIAGDSTRKYIYNDLLSQTLGYVSIDNVGQAGIEQFYDKYLEGIDGSIYTQADLIGRELEGYPQYYVPQIKGLSVQLTIDAKIQLIAENAMSIAYKAHNPKRASCVVMDVTNGEILALAIKPTVNLNELPRDDMEQLLFSTKNVLATEIYEPGSTFKILTVAANLEEYKKGNSKAFSAEHIFKNNANFRVVDSGAKISCWTHHANGKHCNQNISMALNNSCNPIFTDMALSLGKNTFYDYLEKFGYGKTTGVDILGEQAGILIDENYVTTGDLARIGFGQSIAVTALQLANATAATINGGYLYSPKLVKGIVDENNKKIITYPTKTISNPISLDTSKLVANMLQDVVTKGSGKHAYIEGYQVGGKTGTAQKFENGKLAIGKYVSSFVGFFPASQPKYLALVIVDEPVGANYGSIVAAPYAKLIFEQIIYYKNIERIELLKEQI